MKPERHKRNWTPEDLEYLEESWGYTSLGAMAKSLQRTESAIRRKAQYMNLGSSRYAGGIMYSPPQIAKMLGKCVKETYRLINEGVIIAKRKKLVNERAYQVHIDDLLEFLKNHPDKWDSRNVEEFAFGIEPDWMKEKRKNDMELPQSQKSWNKYEESRLMELVREGYSMKEISEEMGRTVNAVYQRTNRMRRKGALNPVKIQLLWTDAEWNLVLELEKQGLTDKEIAYELGREKAHITDKRRMMRLKGLYKGNKKGFKIKAM